MNCSDRTAAVDVFFSYRDDARNEKPVMDETAIVNPPVPGSAVTVITG